MLGFEATAASLAELDLDKLIEAQAAVRDALAAAPDPARLGASIVATSMAFIPVIDGDVLPVHPLAALAAGRGGRRRCWPARTPRSSGCSSCRSGMAAMVTDETLPGFLGALGISAGTAAVYRANRPGASAGDVLCALMTDRFFRLPTLDAAQARLTAGGAAPTYLYEFAWQSPVLGLGAAHAMEIPFVFDNLGCPDAQMAIGTEPPAALAGEMHAAWIRFASTGDPGWPPFDDRRPVRIFGGPAEVVLDPRGDERQSWGQH